MICKECGVDEIYCECSVKRFMSGEDGAEYLGTSGVSVDLSHISSSNQYVLDTRLKSIESKLAELIELLSCDDCDCDVAEGCTCGECED